MNTAPSPPVDRAHSVDAHSHIFTADMPLSPEAWSRPDYAFTAEDFLATLDAHGITHGVVSAATLYGEYSDYTLEALRAHRRLRATVIVSPEIEVPALRDMADAGVVGVRLGIRRARVRPDLASPAYRRLFSRLADLGLHVEILAQSSQLPELLPPIRESGVKLVVDHLGLPDEDLGPRGPGFEMLLRAIEAGDTWTKISASYRTPWPLAQACMARLMEVGGPERLLWGSDAPFVGHEDEVDYPGTLQRFEALVPDAAVRQSIHDAALGLYFG